MTAVYMFAGLGAIAMATGLIVGICGIGPADTLYQRIAALYAQAAALFSLAILSYLLIGGAR